MGDNMVEVAVIAEEETGKKFTNKKHMQSSDTVEALKKWWCSIHKVPVDAARLVDERGVTLSLHGVVSGLKKDDDGKFEVFAEPATEEYAERISDPASGSSATSVRKAVKKPQPNVGKLKSSSSKDCPQLVPEDVEEICETQTPPKTHPDRMVQALAVTSRTNGASTSATSSGRVDLAKGNGASSATDRAAETASSSSRAPLAEARGANNQPPAASSSSKRAVEPAALPAKRAKVAEAPGDAPAKRIADMPGTARLHYNQDNPKRSGSAAHARYEKYKVAKTLKDFYALGGNKEDAEFDRKKGYLKIDC